MASNIPTRRVTRATRMVTKENENVNARPSRITTRSKPLSNSSAAANGERTRAAGTSDLLAQGKRKREALGEVTGKAINNKAKPSLDPKGKGKDGVTQKPVKPASTTRAPLRPVATRSRNNNVQQPTDEHIQDDAMAVDLPIKSVPVAEIPVSRNVNNRTSTRSVATGINAASLAQKLSTRRHIRSASIQNEEDNLEEEPVHKKRRTSSEAGDDNQLETVEEELDTDDRENAALEQALNHVVREELDWDDLDREDDGDPLMVSEYVAEIFDYLRKTEHITMPNPNYMENQKELAWKMRGILIDWLIQVHSRFKLLPETLFLCVNLIDRFLSARVVSLAKLQLVGVSCMFIAAKTEETIAPSVTNFIYCADSSYTDKEILQAEKYILKTIDWNLSYPCPLNFLRRISRADDFNVQVRTIGKFLLEIGCLEWRLLAAPPSLLAASAMWLARLILDFPDWTPNLRHFSTYREEALIPTANLILNYVLKPISHESFYKKYASKRFMKASVFVRGWALQHWEEGTMVNLLADLPWLKEEAELRAAELEN